MSKVLPDSLKPVNRHLLVIPHKNKEKLESGVLLPDDYEPQEDRYVVATVVDASSDCNPAFRGMRRESLPSETRIVIDNSMVEEVKVKKKTHYLILENYVVGILRNFGSE